MKKNVVSRDVAMIEVEKWLDNKKLSDKKRETNKDSIDALIEGIEDGILSIDESDFSIKMNLDFPVGDLKTLTFKARLSVGELHKYLNGVKSTDGDGRILAYVCALTGQNSGLIKMMFLEDYSVASNIAYFFLQTLKALTI